MLWAIALPAVQAVVLSVILSRVARFSVPHYPAYIFSGIVGWTYISTTIASGATSIVDNAALSSRIYFPRAILPLTTCLSNLFAFAVSAVLAISLAWMIGAGIGLHDLLILPAALLLILFASGLTLVLSALHVYFRDTIFFVQALTQVWFYATPIFYPLNLLHGAAHAVITINPLTGIIELLHAAALGGALPGAACLATLAWTIALLMLAAVLHTRFDRAFADLL